MTIVYLAWSGSTVLGVYRWRKSALKRLAAHRKHMGGRWTQLGVRYWLQDEESTVRMEVQERQVLD